MPDTYNFTFGYEELVVLTRLLSIAPLPGLPDDVLGGATEAQIAAALTAAERSLRARGFIEVVPENERINIYSPVVALLGTCAMADVTAMVTVQVGDAAEARFYHATPDMAVERSFPSIGLHRFTGAPTMRDLSGPLNTFLHVTEQVAPNAPDGRITQDVLAQARAAADTRGAAGVLRQAGLNDATAHSLAAALTTTVCTAMISVIYRDEQRKPQGVGALITADGVWLLGSHEENDALDVLPASAAEATARILALMQPDATPAV